MTKLDWFCQHGTRLSAELDSLDAEWKAAIKAGKSYRFSSGRKILISIIHQHGLTSGAMIALVASFEKENNDRRKD